jgi:hypothetical protein
VLPGLGWQMDYIKSALDGDEAENDWGGFMSRWRKDDFDGELWISSHYNQNEDQTEVMFDKTEVLQSTSWIENVPDSICIYQSPTSQNCTEINDKNKIEQITRFINEAMDSNDAIDSRTETLIIDFTDIKINVFYEDKKKFFFNLIKVQK